MSKFLRREIIKLAYNNESLKEHLLPLIRKDADAGQNSYEELLEKEVTNPETGNKVKVKTLRNKPKDSQAYKLYEQLVSKQEKETKVNQLVDSLTKEDRDVLEKKIDETRDDIKRSWSDFKGSGSFGDFVDVLMSLTLTLFEPKEGQRLLDELTESLQIKKENVLEAVAVMKAAEIASMEDEYVETLEKEVKIKPPDQVVKEFDIRQWVEGQKDEMNVNDYMQVWQFFMTIDDSRLGFLKAFVRDGEIDLDKMKQVFSKGVPKTYYSKLDKT